MRGGQGCRSRDAKSVRTDHGKRNDLPYNGKGKCNSHNDNAVMMSAMPPQRLRRECNVYEFGAQRVHKSILSHQRCAADGGHGLE